MPSKDQECQDVCEHQEFGAYRIGDYVHRNNSQLLKRNVEAMLNNQEYGDITFLVNNTQYFACSHLVTMSSKPLGDFVKFHLGYSNRCIRIYGIKFNESFLIILKYIYGVEINFSQTNINFLCEVLSLSEKYDMAEFCSDLKYYLSNLKCFQLDSLVALLNTAEKFCLDDLYWSLESFVFQNAGQFLKQPNFTELNFYTLRKTIRSDWFYTSEIDILLAVLAWVNDNFKDEDPVFEESITVIREFNESAMDINSVPVKIFTSPIFSGLDEDLLEDFISSIRIKQISAFDFLKVFENELSKKYEILLRNTNNYSSNTEPRKPYSTLPIEHGTVEKRNRTRTFTLKFHGQMNTIYESEEEYQLGDLTWKICLKVTDDDHNSWHMYLKCTSTKQNVWECTACCQLCVTSHDPNDHTEYIPDISNYKSVTFSSNNTYVDFGQYYWGKYAFAKNDTCTVEVEFLSLGCKVKKETVPVGENGTEYTQENKTKHVTGKIVN